MANHQTSIEFRPETLSAIDAVRDALQVALEALGTAGVSVKEGRDLVTTADVASEDAIRAALSAAHAIPVIGEERGGDPPAGGSPYWLVDPICGTGNYAAGMKLWCVNVALIEDGAVSVGVVGDPSNGEVLVAERGRGAWALRGVGPVRLAASAASRTVVIEEGKSTGAAREHAARFMAEAVRADRLDFRSLGTTLAMPYLASGAGLGLRRDVRVVAPARRGRDATDRGGGWSRQRRQRRTLVARLNEPADRGRRGHP